MFARSRTALVGLALLFATVLTGQTPPTPVAKETAPPPSKDQVAATVNGQAIPELAVYRGLIRIEDPARREAARKDILNFLIDNAIVDQYLVQLKIQIEPKEVQAHVEKMRAEAKETKQDFDETLKRLQITETELKLELVSALRWDKFVLQQGTEKALRDLFDKNTQMFDGSRVKARHILRPLDGNKDAALSQVNAIKQEIETAAGQALAKLPADADAITREKGRAGAFDKAFADAALKYSSCPSKSDGGDLGYFPRVGAMVEPFARAAFALKPYQLSEPVASEFGYHLILATDAKPGKQVTFEQVKSFVQEVYGERLREAILTHYKAKSKVEIVPLKK